jgi:hypothetical protein
MYNFAFLNIYKSCSSLIYMLKYIHFIPNKDNQGCIPVPGV